VRISKIGFAILGAATIANSVAAQTPPVQPPITRTVIAATKLLTATNRPLLFRALSITIPSAKKCSVSTADGILYQMTGSTEVSIGGETKILNPGEGLFLASGKLASLKAGTSGASTFLHFLLVAVADRNQPVETKPAIVKELFRTATPIPDLKPGSYDLNLTRVTFPAQMPSNPPHHRSGAALYYIISGTGTNTIDGKTDAKERGSLIYEPFGLVHQWGNPSDTSFTFLVFNINPEGVAAVIPGAPAR
jgi:quercetin dioxygenase-like cupin family protein